MIARGGVELCADVGICRKRWDGSPCRIDDGEQDVLPLPGGVWGNAEYADLPSLFRVAGDIARSERAGSGDGDENCFGSELHGAYGQRFPSQELLLSGLAEGLSGEPIRRDQSNWL